MRTDIHVGLHKTGSTHIQALLRRNSATLGKRGILYPETGIRGAGQHQLAWAHTRRDGDPAIWDTLLSEVRETAPDRVILSSEEFEFIRDAGTWRQISAALGGDVRVICYVRPQAEYIESSFGQHIENGHLVEFSGHWGRIARRLQYANLLGALEDALGLNAITVRVFQKKAFAGDLSTDFLTTLGIDPGGLNLHSAPSNPSLSDKALEVACRLGHLVPTQPMRKEMCNILKQEFPLGDKYGKPKLLSDEQRSEIEAFYEDHNTQVARRYLGRDTLFELS